jgi:hypothetical protein
MNRECCYCGADGSVVELRVTYSPPYPSAKYGTPDWQCEKCFTPQDEGPCWDDLPDEIYVGDDFEHDPMKENS